MKLIGLEHGRLNVAVDDSGCVVLIDAPHSIPAVTHTITDVQRLVTDLQTALRVAQEGDPRPQGPTVHCVYRCGATINSGIGPRDTHALMEQHYRQKHPVR